MAAGRSHCAAEAALHRAGHMGRGSPRGDGQGTGGGGSRRRAGGGEERDIGPWAASSDGDDVRGCVRRNALAPEGTAAGYAGRVEGGGAVMGFVALDLVIPAKAGISCLYVQPGGGEMPAFAGMTGFDRGLVRPSSLQASLAIPSPSVAISAKVTCLWPTPKGARI
ncbi:hypothetical protein K663_11030 [Sphingobium sp. MI1205]|nr:hypothetical protein K663_11030 [Sphingobium sp. MI1205]